MTKNQPLWPLVSLTHIIPLILLTRVWYIVDCFMADGSTPYWLCPHTLRHTLTNTHTQTRTHQYTHTRTPPHTNTHTLSLSFPQCCFNNAPPTPPFDTACIDCVPREGLVFYITSDIPLDSPVAPVSVSESSMFSTQLPRLLSPLPLEGCWHCFVFTASTMFKPVLSH